MRALLPLHPPTLIIRHKRENRKKCSLTPLEKCPGFNFASYPSASAPPLPEGGILLAPDAPVLTPEDEGRPLVLIDGTWDHAKKIETWIASGGHVLERRSLPPEWKTAYPRRQDVKTGLASIEALYAAYTLFGWERNHLLYKYYWREDFLLENQIIT